VLLGAGADRFRYQENPGTAVSGSLAMSIFGDQGNDRVQGGPGNDRIVLNQQNPAEQDFYGCGKGNDVAEVDLKDSLFLNSFQTLGSPARGQATTTDCEVTRSGPAGEPPTVSIVSRTVRLRDGKAQIRLRCEAGGARCKGRLVLRRPVAGRKPKSAAFSSGDYSIAAGATYTVSLGTRPARVRKLSQVRWLQVTATQQATLGRMRSSSALLSVSGL
jgi:hypothetical protein